jgi:hypothetical protein
MEVVGMQETAFGMQEALGFGIQVIPPTTIIEILADNDPGDPRSGEIPFTLFQQVPVGSHVDPSLSITVTGRPFRGTLDHLAGAKVTESPVRYDGNGAPGSVGGQRAYIVDFGASLSVLSLNMIDPGLTGTIPGIVLVLPWLGTDFSPKAAYGAEQGNRPLPVPTTASTVVGLPGIESTKLLIQVDGNSLAAGDFAAHCRVTLGTYPANVRASLNDRLPFWTKPGSLREEQPANGFAQDLNTLLASLTTPVDVTLVLTSDVPGVLGIGGWNPPPGGVIHTAAARWGGQAATQVALAALESQAVTIPFPIGSPAVVTDLTLAVAGAFPPWRSYPAQALTAPGNLGMKVDANFSVARRMQFASGATVYGVTLPVRASGADTQIRLEVQADQGGLPAGGKPIAGADLSLGATTAGDVTWREVLFASPAAIAAGKGVWLVAKARTGGVEWVGVADRPDPGARTVVASGGGPWDDYPPVDAKAPLAQLRVLRRPFPAENTPLLDLAWAEPPGATFLAEPAAATVQVDMQAPAAGAAALQPSGGNVTVVVSLTARSSGTLSIKGATLGYQDPGP